MSRSGFPDRDAADGLLTDPAAFETPREEIVAFVRDRVARTGSGGAVVALRGGVGSTVAAVLAAEALDPHRVLGLAFPGQETAPPDAETVARGLGIEYREPPLGTLLDLFEDEVAPVVTPENGRRAVERAADGLASVCARYAATATNRLVVGAADRTEWLVGEADRTADLLPLGDLYASEVRALARHLGVPEGVIADAGGSAAGEPIDAVLHRLVDEDEGIESTADDLGVDAEAVRRHARVLDATRHDRAALPTPGAASGGYDHFHELELRFE